MWCVQPSLLRQRRHLLLAQLEEVIEVLRIVLRPELIALEKLEGRACHLDAGLHSAALLNLELVNRLLLSEAIHEALVVGLLLVLGHGLVVLVEALKGHALLGVSLHARVRLAGARHFFLPGESEGSPSRKKGLLVT